MKKLLGIIIVLCAAALFSLQAGAGELGVQIQPTKQRYIAPPPQPRNVQQQYTQPVAQWASVSYTQQTISQNFKAPQQNGAANGEVAQNLRAFSQQAQADLNDFRK